MSNSDVLLPYMQTPRQVRDKLKAMGDNWVSAAYIYLTRNSLGRSDHRRYVLDIATTCEKLKCACDSRPENVVTFLGLVDDVRKTARSETVEGTVWPKIIMVSSTLSDTLTLQAWIRPELKVSSSIIVVPRSQMLDNYDLLTQLVMIGDKSQ